MTQPRYPLEGILPIVVTPFADDDSIDEDSLRTQAEFLLDSGVTGLGVGFGSEVPRLTDDERTLVAKVLVEAAAGRAPVMASCGADSTYATVKRTEAAASTGVNVVMIAPPATGNLDAILEHYIAVARRVDIPIVVQDAPSSTGVRMPATFLGDLTNAVPQIVAIKVEELPTAPKVQATVRAVSPDVIVLGGAGGLDFYNELTRGARGTVPGPGHPKVFVHIYEEFVRGNLVESRRIWERYLPFLQFVSRSMDVFLLVEKEILRRRGLVRSSRLRPPGLVADGALWAEVDAVLDHLGTDDVLAAHGSLDG